MSAEQARSATTTRQLSGATEGSGYTEEGYEVMKCITLVLNSSLFLDLESRFHTTVGSVQVLSCLTRLTRNPMSFIKKKSQKNTAPAATRWKVSGYHPKQCVRELNLNTRPAAIMTIQTGGGRRPAGQKQQQTAPIPCSFSAAVEPVSEFARTAYCPTALNRLLAPLPTWCTVQLRSPGNNLLSIRQVTTGRGLADQEHAQVDKGMTVFHFSVYMLRIYTNP